MLINESISIARSREMIWSYWLDVGNDVHWRNGITKAEWTSRPPFGIASTGEHTHEKIGKLNWEVTSFEDGRSFEFLHTAGGLKGSIAIFQVEAEERGSRVQLRMRVSGLFIMRIMMLFMRNIMRKGVRGDLQKLKIQLEKS